MNKRGANILIENIVFLILNLVFLTILIFFVFSRMGGTAVLEEQYAKQIALMVDSAKPGMVIKLDMKKGFDKSDKVKWGRENVVSISENIVTVKLSEKSGYSYSFFNDVDVSAYPDIVESNYHIIKINEYKNE
jgi:hypothetical protein